MEPIILNWYFTLGFPSMISEFLMLLSHRRCSRVKIVETFGSYCVCIMSFIVFFVTKEFRYRHWSCIIKHITVILNFKRPFPHLYGKTKISGNERGFVSCCATDGTLTFSGYCLAAPSKPDSLDRKGSPRYSRERRKTRSALQKNEDLRETGVVNVSIYQKKPSRKSAEYILVFMPCCSTPRYLDLTLRPADGAPWTAHPGRDTFRSIKMFMLLTFWQAKDPYS